MILDTQKSLVWEDYRGVCIPLCTTTATITITNNTYTLFCSLTPQCPAAGNSMHVSHMGNRDLTSSAITCYLPGAHWQQGRNRNKPGPLYEMHFHMSCRNSKQHHICRTECPPHFLK